METLPRYDFYAYEYRGVGVPESEFARLIVRADEEIRHYERVFTVSGTQEERDLALCAIADILHTYETVAAGMLDGNGTVRSVSIGSVGTSFAVPDPKALGLDMTEDGQRRAIFSALKRYMTVYRGV